MDFPNLLPVEGRDRIQLRFGRRRQVRRYQTSPLVSMKMLTTELIVHTSEVGRPRVWASQIRCARSLPSRWQPGQRFRGCVLRVRQIAIAARSPLLERRSQVAEEPLACQPRYLFEGPGLFEEMRGAGYYRKLVLATDPLLCCSVQVEHHLVVSTDN